MAELNRSWQPTEGHKRAEKVVQVLECDGVSTGHAFTPEFRWRMVEVIAAAIDRALPPETPVESIFTVASNGVAAQSGETSLTADIGINTIAKKRGKPGRKPRAGVWKAPDPEA